MNVSEKQQLQVYLMRNTRNNLINYCYLINNERNKNAVIIDPAWEPCKFEDLLKKNDIQNISILLTHHHADHVDLAEYFAAKYNCSVFMSYKEISYYNFNCKNLISLDSESSITINGITIKPIFTPGHTAGSICYLMDNYFFTGDTLFIEGCGICTSKGGDPYAMYRSLNRIKDIVTQECLIYPGHRYHYDLGQKFKFLLEYNIYLQINDQEQFVKFRMRKGQEGLFNFK